MNKSAKEALIMSVKKRFCFLIDEQEEAKLKSKADSLGLNASDFIRSRIFTTTNKAKEQCTIKMISGMNEMQKVLLKLSSYIKTYKSADIYALEMLCSIDQKLTELKNDL